jgi:hypothetical protein
MSTLKQNLGTSNALTVTNLANLASSATAGWKSALVDNTTTLALDYQLSIMLPMANTAPANDKLVYVYLYGAFYDGSYWRYTDGGTATPIDGTEGTYTIANPNDLILFASLNYTTQYMTLNMGGRYIARAFGGRMPDGWGIVVVNYSGAALAASGHQIAYKALTETIS